MLGKRQARNNAQIKKEFFPVFTFAGYTFPDYILVNHYSNAGTIKRQYKVFAVMANDFNHTIKRKTTK